MNPEMQILVERLEAVERKQRGTLQLALLTTAIAVAALAAQFLSAHAPPAEQVRYSVVEANRFLLRDVNGEISGGLEVERPGTIKLVLGRSAGGTAAAFLEAQSNGIASLKLCGPDGAVRAALVGGSMPSVLIAPPGQSGSAGLVTMEDGGCSLYLVDPSGKAHYQRP